MTSTLERLRSRKATRLGYYRDLVRESGACESKGSTFPDGDLHSLYEVSAELGLTEKSVGDDLAASRRYVELRNQIAIAESQKPAAEKTITKIEKQIADLDERRKPLGLTTHGGKHDREIAEIAAEIKRLQDQHREARKPIGQCEVARREIDELVAQHPWVKAGHNGV